MSREEQKPAFAKPVLAAVPFSEVYLEDCTEALKRFDDNHFDLAIVDPPYGINVAKTGKVGGNNAGKAKDYGAKEWDKQPPNDEYFRQLFRVSKNQIVWGANHFISKMPFDSSCWLVWDKDNSGNFADCELAWTSFDTAVRKFQWRWNGMLQQNMKDKEERIHPTQKPIALYEWILQNYAERGNLILDTHLGSGSSRIAADKGGFNFIGFEIDADYYEKSKKRFNDFKSQLRMF
ncbi:MAG: site-specific DNA-methyltransferase [Proteobacteria bacterium]|nr:site-specific DNA-methyltransferase [Pseudomonadota bacterium]